MFVRGSVGNELSRAQIDDDNVFHHDGDTRVVPAKPSSWFDAFRGSTSSSMTLTGSRSRATIRLRRRRRKLLRTTMWSAIRIRALCTDCAAPQDPEESQATFEQLRSYISALRDPDTGIPCFDRRIEFQVSAPC